MTKKTIIWIGVGLAFTIGAVLLYKKISAIKTDAEKQTAPPKAKEKDQMKGNDNFPLKLGSYGDRVRSVQAAFNIVPTGYFDATLEAAIFKTFKVKQITEAQYNAGLKAANFYNIPV